jgi:hypothetical protein
LNPTNFRKGSATGVQTGQKSEPDPKKKKKKKNQIDLILPWLDLKIWVPTEHKQVNEEREREREAPPVLPNLKVPNQIMNFLCSSQ